MLLFNFQYISVDSRILQILARQNLNDAQALYVCFVCVYSQMPKQRCLLLSSLWNTLESILVVFEWL